LLVGADTFTPTFLIAASSESLWRGAVPGFNVWTAIREAKSGRGAGGGLLCANMSRDHRALAIRNGKAEFDMHGIGRFDEKSRHVA
jgi:hypothetical protein